MFDYYIDTLTEYLQEFLDRNEIECNVELGRDFAYLHSESKIIYALLVLLISQKGETCIKST